MTQATVGREQGYALGHATDELDRLVEQGRFFGDLTAQVLRQAGIARGMRVLDIGCGAGDVSFLAASLVGPEGTVIGVDRSPEAIDFATRRATVAGLANVRFIAGDVAELALDEPVDALIGRLILMYFPDPAVTLRRLLGLLKPDGIAAFHEFDLAGTKSLPTCPLFEQTMGHIRQALTRAGADIQTGLKLGWIFREAGLPEPQMILGARVERGAASVVYEQVMQITRTLLPVIVRTGIATAEEIGIATLADRLREEAVALDATLVSPCFIGGWVRKAS